MGNSYSRVAPARSVRILDSHTRARYLNQRENIFFRRKLANITDEHGQALAQITANRHDARTTMQKIHHEIKQKELAQKSQRRMDQISQSSFQESDLCDTNKLINSSLLMHDLNASNEWEKSMIFPDIYAKSITRCKPVRNLQSFLLRYPSEVKSNSHLFQRSESTLSNKNLTLRQETQRMKQLVQIAVAKSTRDSNIAARRASRRH